MRSVTMQAAGYRTGIAPASTQAAPRLLPAMTLPAKESMRYGARDKPCEARHWNIFRCNTHDMPSFTSRKVASLAAGFLLATGASLTQAHSHAIAQVPTANSTLTTAPDHVAVAFDARVELPFSSIVVKGPDGQTVATGKLAYDSEDQKSLRAPITAPNLAAGTYRIEWNVTSADSHKVRGSSNFTLQP